MRTVDQTGSFWETSVQLDNKMHKLSKRLFEGHSGQWTFMEHSLGEATTY